jgi:serine-type D-Ala-D-Ala carboxypeptidase (penicillin-binding protein 5/6)
MRRRFAGLFAVIIVAVFVAYGFVAYKKPLPALASSITPAADAAATPPKLQWPVHAEAAIAAIGYGVLATHGTQKAQPTASVAKVMTALAVLKQHPLAAGQQGPVLTMTQADVNSYNAYVAEDGSVAKVAKGEKITEYQALEALLLPSADNIADTLAIWSYGSIKAYSAAANSYAASIGMGNSYFGTADASGYSPETVSTAHDLVLLGQVALKNPVIAQIVAKPVAKIPVAGAIQNVNWLLGQYCINGIKTGNTDQAGGVYLFSAKQKFASGKSVTVIGVVMDKTATLFQALDESVPLLKSTEANFAMTPLVHAGEVMGTYSVPWNGTINAIAAKSLTAITWRGQSIKPKVSLRRLSTPITAGTQVGTISFSSVPKTVPVVVNQSVSSPTWHWRFLHAF